MVIRPKKRETGRGGKKQYPLDAGFGYLGPENRMPRQNYISSHLEMSRNMGLEKNDFRMMVPNFEVWVKEGG